VATTSRTRARCGRSSPARPPSKQAGLEPDDSQLGKYADNLVPLEGSKAQQMLKLYEALEDQDDVQNVWTNFDISDQEMEAAAAS
jgi:hypothetical protein